MQKYEVIHVIWDGEIQWRVRPVGLPHEVLATFKANTTNAREQYIEAKQFAQHCEELDRIANGIESRYGDWSILDCDVQGGSVETGIEIHGTS